MQLTEPDGLKPFEKHTRTLFSFLLLVVSQFLSEPSLLLSAFFRVENWFPLLREHTFDTRFLPLSLREAKALAQYRELTRLHLLYELQLRMEKTGEFNEKGIDNGAHRRAEAAVSLSPEERELMESVGFE
jgi:hypothetical protein